MTDIDWARVTSCVATADGPAVSYGDGAVGVGQYRATGPMLPPLTSRGALIQFPQPGYRARPPNRPPPIYGFSVLQNGLFTWQPLSPGSTNPFQVQQFLSCSQIAEHALNLYFSYKPTPTNQVQVVVSKFTPGGPCPLPGGGPCLPGLMEGLGTFGLKEAQAYPNALWLKCPAGT